METIYISGKPCHTSGKLPSVGEKAPCYELVTKDLRDITCRDFENKRVVLNIFPSLDTPVCAAGVHRFNKEAAELENTAVICVSMDLPFAAARFCVANGIDNCIVASAFRSPMFVRQYGVQIVDGPLAGLLARAVIILDPSRTVIYRELVDEITHEPDYESALEVLRRK